MRESGGLGEKIILKKKVPAIVNEKIIPNVKKRWRILFTYECKGKRKKIKWIKKTKGIGNWSI